MLFRCCWIPFSLLAALVVVLVNAQSTTSSSLGQWPSDMEVRANPGETVHVAGVMEVKEADPLTSEGNPTVLYVESDLPVVAKRLTAGGGAFLESPIPWASATVVVKSSGCPEGTSVDFTIENSTMVNGKDYSLKITTTSTTAQPSSSNTNNFMDSSSLFRQLQCISQVGPPCEPPTTSPPAPAAAPTATEGGDPSPAPGPTDEEEEDKSQAAATTTKASLLVSIILMIFSTLFSSSSARGSNKGYLLFVAISGLIGAVIMIFMPSSSSTQVQASRDLQECTINVEIAYWGCTTLLNVSAPALTLRNMQFLETTEDLETCNCTSLAIFPDLDAPRDKDLIEYWDFDANNDVTVSADGMTQQVPLADSGNCLIAIGRPFRDKDGINIQSTPTTTTKPAVWSQSDRELFQKYNSYVTPAPAITTATTNYTAVLKDWIQRASGEHASIASFAAFTIALMSNGAPPHLISASLQAAQDELRHAQISFQVATLLMKHNEQDAATAVEPTALPPSSHTFGADLMALATAVIQEGCVDETLSALQMADQYDDYHASVQQDQDKDDTNDQMMMWMWNITAKIALEEGQHSVLAWRTIQWICQTDTTTTICDQLVQEGGLLSTDRLLKMALKKYNVNSRVYLAFKCLAPKLVCHVTIASQQQQSSFEGCQLQQQPQQQQQDLLSSCRSLDDADDNKKTSSSLLVRLVNEIGRGVVVEEEDVNEVGSSSSSTS